MSVRPSGAVSRGGSRSARGWNVLQHEGLALVQARASDGDAEGARALAMALAAIRPPHLRAGVYLACNVPVPPPLAEGAVLLSAGDGTVRPGARLYHAVRRRWPPRLALQAAGLTPEGVLAAGLPVLRRFSAAASALARDLARRALGTEPDLVPVLEAPASPLSVGGEEEEAGTLSRCPLEPLDAPPSPRLRAATVQAILGEGSRGRSGVARTL